MKFQTAFAGWKYWQQCVDNNYCAQIDFWCAFYAQYISSWLNIIEMPSWKCEYQLDEAQTSHCPQAQRSSIRLRHYRRQRHQQLLVNHCPNGSPLTSQWDHRKSILYRVLQRTCWNSPSVSPNNQPSSHRAPSTEQDAVKSGTFLKECMLWYLGEQELV